MSRPTRAAAHTIALAIILVIVLALLFTLPRLSAPPTSPNVRDGIISLAPSVTEILFALGLKDRILGVTTACDYPPEAKDLRKIGDFGAPRLEILYQLKPALVIATELRDPEVARAIEAAGIRLITVPQSTLDDVPAAMELIGAAAQVPDAARRLARDFRDRVSRATVTVPDAKRPRVFVEISENPLATCGPGSFLNDLVARAGGYNIAHDLPKPWYAFSPDLVLARDPEIIIVLHPVPSDARSAIAHRIGWGNVSAVRAGWVVAGLDPDHLQRPGPRLADGLEALARLFNRFREGRQP